MTDKIFGLHALFKAVDPDEHCAREAKYCRRHHKAKLHQKTLEEITLEWVHCLKCEMVYMLKIKPASDK